MFGDVIYVDEIPCFKIERPGIIRIFDSRKDKLKNKEIPY